MLISHANLLYLYAFTASHIVATDFSSHNIVLLKDLPRLAYCPLDLRAALPISDSRHATAYYTPTYKPEWGSCLKTALPVYGRITLEVAGTQKL
eukprot:IDg21112t1